MRSGKVVANLKTNNTSPEELAEKMVGRKVLLSIEKKEPKIGNKILTVKNLNHLSKDGVDVLKNVSFSISEGEILGVAGVAGNGQSELLDILSGIEQLQRGEIEINQTRLLPGEKWDPKKVREMGMAHVPEDRQKRGLILPFYNYENSILGYQRKERYSSGFLLDKNKILNLFTETAEQFDVRPRNPNIASNKLSGGNQQKLVLAREIQSQPKILLIGQPTRGVDIGAIERIYEDLLRLKDSGTAILLVSVELDEIMSLSDRIIVFYEGRVIAEFPSNADPNIIGLAMAGVN